MGSDDKDDFNWPSEEAERAKLFLPKSHDRCFFRFDEDRGLLKVVSNNSTDENTHDIIDPKDIIGVDVEIELMTSPFDRNASEPRSATSFNGGNNSGFANENNKPASEIPVDTQASAVLSIYVYPKKQLGIKESILKFCGTERNSSESSRVISALEEKYQLQERSDTSKSSKRQARLWYRHAQHRRFTVAPTEDLSDLSIMVTAIRKLSRPPSLATPDKGERILVIVNPCSGKKTGVLEYERTLRPMLEQAGICHDCLITTHEKHAEERMQKQDFQDISEYNGIVLVGGDGIIHEIMQGIHRRDDSDKILKKIKLGAIGAGTCNGFSASLAHASKENFSPVDSSFMIVKGMSSWIDLSRYETKSSSYTSFLTFSWAMIADIDIESECIRWAGFLRMDLWGILRVLFLRKYRAKFSYLPPTEDRKMVSMPPLSEPLTEGWITSEDDFILFWASQVSHAAEHVFQAPQCKLNDGVFHIWVVRGNVSRLRIALILLAMEHGGHVAMNGVEFIECSAYRLEPITKGSFNNLDGEVIESGPIQATVLPSSILAYCNPQLH